MEEEDFDVLPDVDCIALKTGYLRTAIKGSDDSCSSLLAEGKSSGLRTIGRIMSGLIAFNRLLEIDRLLTSN